MIHPTAIIHPCAQIEDNVSIGPFSVIEDNVSIAQGCKIGEHVIIRSGSILEENVFVSPFGVIGGLPQVLHFSEDLKTGVRIGKCTVLREGVTINRATLEGSLTRVGEHCFLMANSHVAHDCQLGDYVVFANGVLPAGHVKIGSYSVFGGNAVIHQHLNIGEGVMIAGRAALNMDIPPFLLVSEHNQVHGLNTIGLKRRRFKLEEIKDLKTCFKSVLGKPGNPYEYATHLLASKPNPSSLAQTFLDFFTKKSSKGCIHHQHLQLKKNCEYA